MSDFANFTWPIGRKDYRCEWCGQIIPKGEKHLHFAGIWEGDWQNWRMHSECHEGMQLEDPYNDGWTPAEHERPRKENTSADIDRKSNKDSLFTS